MNNDNNANKVVSTALNILTDLENSAKDRWVFKHLINNECVSLAAVTTPECPDSLTIYFSLNGKQYTAHLERHQLFGENSVHKQREAFIEVLAKCIAEEIGPSVIAGLRKGHF